MVGGYEEIIVYGAAGGIFISLNQNPTATNTTGTQLESIPGDKTTDILKMKLNQHLILLALQLEVQLLLTKDGTYTHS